MAFTFSGFFSLFSTPMVLKWMCLRFYYNRQQKKTRTKTKRNWTYASQIRPPPSRWQIYATHKWDVRTSRFWSISRCSENSILRALFNCFPRARSGSPYASSLRSNEHTCKNTRNPYRCRINVKKPNENVPFDFTSNRFTYPFCSVLSICKSFSLFIPNELQQKPNGCKSWPRRKPLSSGKYLVVKKRLCAVKVFTKPKALLK